MTRPVAGTAVALDGAHRARVWFGRSPVATPADWAVLSTGERARAHRFVDPEETECYVHAHAAVRRLLAHPLGLAPEALRFGRWPCPQCSGSDHGPPRIIHPPAAPRFNQSRSGADWLLATTPGDTRVGVDLEPVRSLATSFDNLMTNCLTPEERDHVRQPTEPAERHRRFFRCWARKEAVLKAVGSGLAGGLTRVHVRPWESGGTPVTFDGPGAGRFLVSDVPVRDGVAAAVAEELNDASRMGRSADG
ncbi:4'-phosphopantetheinyl transferase superfamily protein [Streptomyces sp. AJS327]|uniref:4'-phosphopantetheinyl transferase family protein n=1 Tax=Streptomyces sp. AJS327 TaxID=2545265 RepID=UPI0015DE03E7|nr:4'-phosphopantetheinyl transferase superfamily protein [Streptomyces sp. AJS327]MBA0053727.1 4'-phosphopantetheinyl transferase superfamily protein [Streptomyces sp. AJS327]